MPIVPPAPPAFSTRTCCFSASPIAAASTRASVSVGPPAAAGTTMTIGFAGYSCANPAVAASRKAAAKTIRNRFIASSVVRVSGLAELLLQPREGFRGEVEVGGELFLGDAAGELGVLPLEAR